MEEVLDVVEIAAEACHKEQHVTEVAALASRLIRKVPACALKVVIERIASACYSKLAAMGATKLGRDADATAAGSSHNRTPLWPMSHLSADSDFIASDVFSTSLEKKDGRSSFVGAVVLGG